MAVSKSGLSLAVLTRNFADLHPALADDEASAAAARCLFCYDAPCTRACPTHIDIPRFIRQILYRDSVGAAHTILDANIFGGSCARACPTEVLCEGACVENTLHKEPVLIGRLQRYACDAADEAGARFFEAGASTGKRVAVVGSGPAGLSCGHELRKLGHAVNVYEASGKPGGLNTYGIAAYKISTEFALREAKRVQGLGVKILLERPVDGKGLQKLLAEYDAVFFAAGLGRTAPLGIAGEEMPGVWESLEFIFQTHTKPLGQCKVGKRVVVIGGGNTAIDAANAAVRLGAEQVTVAYRRDEEAMPAFTHEHDGALANGVEFVWNAVPQRIVTSAGKAAGVRFLKSKQSGRGRAAKLTTIKGSEFTLPCDMVIKALGQERRVDLLKALPALKLTRDFRIEVDPATLATSVPKLFAGGDCRAGAKEEIVYAVQDGKIAAAGIHAMLSAAKRNGK